MTKYREGQIVMGSDGKTPYKMTGGQWVKVRETALVENPADESGFQFGEMAGNIVPSGKQYLGSFLNAALHPVQTVKGMASAGTGAAQYANDAVSGVTGLVPDFIGKPAKEVATRLVPGLSAASTIAGATDEDYRPYAKAVKDFYVNRYGSVDKALETIESDPVGALADASSVLSIVAPNAGAAVNPLNIVKNSLKVTAKALIPKGLPERMYASAAKFSTTIPAAERSAMVRTALQNKLNLSSKGVEKLESLIAGYNDDISNLIQKAQQSGKTIPKRDLFQHIAELKARRGGVKWNAGSDLTYIDDAVQQFDDYLTSIGKVDLTPSDVQGLKVDLYKIIDWDAGNQTLTPVKDDLLRTVARGAKDELENVSPEIGLTNDQLGPLYDLQPNLSRSASRIENRNLIGLQAPVQTGVGAAIGNAVAGPPGAMVGGGVGTAASILGLPKISGANAIRLQQLIDDGYVQTIMRNNPGISAVQLSAILAERIRESDQKEKQR